MKQSAISLKFETYNWITGKIEPYLGQAFLLRSPDESSTMFVTALHNISSEENRKGELEICLSPHTCTVASGVAAFVKFPNRGWVKEDHHAIKLRDGVTWSSGFDISLGPSTNAEEQWTEDPVKAEMLKRLLKSTEPLKVVEDNFPYAEGLKVGILVWTPSASPDKKEFSVVDIEKGQEESSIKQVCGDTRNVMIYTGTISHVGTKHIEYNVNSFKGYSGGAVLVMERGHPAFGKAIAVHGGYQDELGTNIGFKLAGVFDRLEVE